MNSAGVGKIPKDIKWEFFYVRNLRVAMKDNKVVQRFCDKFMGNFCHMEHLSIDGGSIESLREEDEAFSNLHCNLLESSAYQRIKTMDIKHVDFRDRYVSEYHRPGGMMVRQLRQTVARKRWYPRLQSLVVSDCKFDTVVNPSQVPWFQERMERMDPRDLFDNTYVPIISEERCQDCPLHTTLRMAPNLRELQIVCHPSMLEGRFDRPQTQPRPEERAQLPKVTCLTIPPVSVWTLDIHTPNVQSLNFALLPSTTFSMPYDRTSPMIPTPEESPVDINNLFKITHLAFECAKSDTVDRLEAWLSRVPNLTSLVIQGNKTAPPSGPLPPSQGRSTYRSSPISTSVLEGLIANSQSIPKLDTLELKNCDLSDQYIVEFVKMRAESPYTTRLVKLVLHGHNTLSAAAHAWLHKAVIRPNGQSGFTHDLGNLTRAGARGVCDLCKL
jgi:hypothetical protein